MPPKAKFTKEEIIQAALALVRTEGFEALTARALAMKLNSSPRPIFTVFQSMEEVQQETIAAARKCYGTYVKQGLSQKELPAFKGVGMQYIQFALKEPKLFQLLFMSEQTQKTDVQNILPVIEEHYDQILLSVQTSYALNQADSEWVYRHLWIYTHGIAVLCATNMCTFTPKELGNMLTEICTAILKERKGNKRND